MTFKSTWSRRNFLTPAAGTSAAIMLKPPDGWAVQQPDPRIAKIVAATIGVDAHNHVDVPLLSAEVPGLEIDLSGEMKRSGLSAICMTFALDYQKLNNPGDAYDWFINGLDSMDNHLQVSGMKSALNLADIRSAHDKHQPTVIQSAGFGLIHGLAFASVLLNLELSAGKLVLSILGFNLGIELMQLFVIALIVPWLILLSKTPVYKWIRINGAY